MPIYRLLSKIFPRAFRREFEEELEAAAAEMLRTEGARGRGHRLRLWSGLVADAMTTGLAQRRAERAGRRLTAGSLLREWRQAVRALMARPASAIVVIALLAVTMGANATVFGVVNATLLRPLPFADPDRLVLLWERYDPMNMTTMPWSDPDYVDARVARSFSGTSIFRSRRVVLTGRGEPASLRLAMVEGNMFDLLGVRPALGRVFTAADSAARRDDVVILSHRVWTQRFGADRGVVGSPVVIDNRPRTVIGVLPEDVAFPPPITFSGQMMAPVTDLYLPYAIDTTAEARGQHSSFAVGRLRDGVGLEAARQELSAIASDVERRFPDSNTGIKMTAAPLHGQSVMTIQTVLVVLLAAVAGVLLIACASIANLILARAFSRGHEMALRSALGASRASLIRQLLFESATLGIVGTICGLAAAEAISGTLLAINPIDLPEMFRSSLDWRVLGFTAAMTVTAIVAFGLVPALQGSRTDLVTVLRGARATASSSERRTRAALVVVQVALAMVTARDQRTDDSQFVASPGGRSWLRAWRPRRHRGEPADNAVHGRACPARVSGTAVGARGGHSRRGARGRGHAPAVHPGSQLQRLQHPWCTAGETRRIPDCGLQSRLERIRRGSADTGNRGPRFRRR